MMTATCECGRTYRHIIVLPVHCGCGAKIGNVAAVPSPRRPATVRAMPHTFGSVLREMVGCGCELPIRKWDRRGLQWCRDNAEQIAQRLTAEPRPAVPIDRSRELVRLAIEIANRSAPSEPQSAKEEHGDASHAHG